VTRSRASDVARDDPGPAASSDAVPRLTLTEARIAGLVARGMTNVDIAARLGTEPSVVDAHVAHACRRLGLRSRTELALLIPSTTENEPGQVR